MQTLDTYKKAFAAIPSAARTPQRQAALDQFLAQGLPTRRQERWKYTDLSRLQTLTPETSGVSEADQSWTLSSNADAMDALNAAFSSGGLSLDIASNTSSEEVILASGTGHRRHRVKIGRGSSAVMRLEIDPNAEFQTVFLDIELEAGANLKLLRLHNAADSAHHVTRIRAQLDRDSCLDVSTVDLGGKLSRHDLEVDLVGKAAQMNLRSLFFAKGTSHIDNQTRFDHRASHCSSRETIRGLAQDSGRGIFNGKIVVHPGAQKTDSEQRIANLILSPKAEIDAKPELEIYADDVKCAHGATFGQLDMKALFYLRSRGLSEADARALLTLAFAMAPLKDIPVAAFREEVTALVVEKLGAKVDDALLA